MTRVNAKRQTTDNNTTQPTTTQTSSICGDAVPEEVGPVGRGAHEVRQQLVSLLLQGLIGREVVT